MSILSMLIERFFKFTSLLLTANLFAYFHYQDSEQARNIEGIIEKIFLYNLFFSVILLTLKRFFNSFTLTDILWDIYFSKKISFIASFLSLIFSIYWLIRFFILGVKISSIAFGYKPQKAELLNEISYSLAVYVYSFLFYIPLVSTKIINISSNVLYLLLLALSLYLYFFFIKEKFKGFIVKSKRLFLREK